MLKCATPYPCSPFPRSTVPEVRQGTDHRERRSLGLCALDRKASRTQFPLSIPELAHHNMITLILCTKPNPAIQVTRVKHHPPFRKFSSVFKHEVLLQAHCQHGLPYSLAVPRVHVRPVDGGKPGEGGGEKKRERQRDREKRMRRGNSRQFTDSSVGPTAQLRPRQAIHSSGRCLLTSQQRRRPESPPAVRNRHRSWAR